MADVGLDADLVLDIRSALEQTRRIERALDRATTGVTVRVTADTRSIPGEVAGAVDAADSTVIVTGEAAGLTGDVTAAIDNADSTVSVTGDASQLTGEVTTAVDAGDSTVIVTGDASQITGEVTSAVDAGDTNVVLTADDSDIRSASGAVSGLDDALGAAAGSAGGLAAILATISVAAIGAGLAGLVGAASELEQAIGGTTAIFGEFGGIVDTFARGAAEAAGLTEQSARTVTSQIGGLLQGFGFTQQEAAKTSVVLAQLGADLAATFGGKPEEAVQALGAALRGEFDPLERFGVSLNITQANLKAVELGLADSTSNVSLNARAQASLALIMERSAQAQGQFGREVNTTAGQLERARAELGNTAAAVGATLQPAVNDLIAAFRADLIPALGELGTSLGPSLVQLVTALLPAFGTFSDLLIALQPIISAFATVISSIPAPIIAVVGTFLAFRAAAGPVGALLGPLATGLANAGQRAVGMAAGMTTASGATGGLRGAIAGVVGGFTPLTAVLAAAAIGFTIYASRQAEAKARQAELATQTAKLREALASADGSIEGITAQLTDMARKGDDVVVAFSKLGNIDIDLSSALRRAGLTVDDFVEALSDTDQPLDTLLEKLSRQGNEGALAAASLRTLAEGYETESQAAIQAGIATETYTRAQAESAIAATQNADGTNNYTAALGQLSAGAAEAQAAEEAHAQALTEQQKALQELSITAPALALSLEALASGTERSTSLLGLFAVEADKAGLSGAALDAVAAQLGATSGPELQAALEAVAGTITGLRDAALGTIPSLQDIAGEVDEFSLQSFRDELADSLTALNNFNENLALIAEEGGPRLAAAAAQLGPGFAAKIAEGIRSGNPAVVAEAELLLAGIEAAGADTSALITNQLGPDLAAATGQMGTLATTAFGTNFSIDPSGQIVQAQETIIGGRPGVQTRMAELGTAGATGFASTFHPDPTPGVGEAKGGITSGKPGIGAAGTELGTSGKGGFEGSFKPDPRPAIAQARALVIAGKGPADKAGDTLGRATVEGYLRGVRGIVGAARAAAGGAVGAVAGLRDAARSAGFSVGSSLGAGIAAGIGSWTSQIASAAARAVASAAAAARAQAQAASPSKVFAEIGGDIGEGLALGIERTAGLSADAVAAVISEAASAAVSAAPLPVAQVAAVSASDGATGANPSIQINFGERSIVLEGTGDSEADARRIGTLVVDTVGRRVQSARFTARAG